LNQSHATNESMQGKLFQTRSTGILRGLDRDDATELVMRHHYTHSVPSGKSHYLAFEEAIVIWSIPANCNIGVFLIGEPAIVWELSRLWAPNGHDRNLLSRAISFAVRQIVLLERPDLLVSYADPNVGHSGGVYRAASWIFHGQSEDTRMYRDSAGRMLARRAFHSGNRGMTKEQIEAAGYEELYMPGKLRFVKPISKKAKRIFQ
jgi:hypothetical protein